MCNCINELEERAKNMFTEKEKDFEKITSCSIDNKSLVVMGSKLVSRLIAPITISYTRKTKKGNLQNKTWNSGIVMGYCPFCGEKVGSEEQE